MGVSLRERNKGQVVGKKGYYGNSTELKQCDYVDTVEQRSRQLIVLSWGWI